MTHKPTPDTIAEIAGKLTERPRLALLGDGWPGGLTWPEIVELARKPGDKRAMAYRSVVLPLMERDLVKVVRPIRYIEESGEWVQKLFALTPLGLQVKDHLEQSSQ